MESSSGYGSWPMQPNSNPELAWHLGPSNAPPLTASTPMQSLYSPVPSSSSTTMTSTLYPAFPGGEHNFVQQQQQQQLQQQYYQQQQQQQQQQQPQQQQLYPPQSQWDSPQYAGASPLSVAPINSGASTSNGFSGANISVNATVFNELKVMYPHASSEQLINAILLPPGSGSGSGSGQQQQPQLHLNASQPLQMQTQTHAYHQSPPLHHQTQVTAHLQAPSSYAQSSVQGAYGSQSGHSLANALTFTSPSSIPAQLTSSSAISAHDLPLSASAPTSNVAAAASTPSMVPDSAPVADGKKKKTSKTTTKLRQSKLTFLPGIAQAVSKEATQSPPSATAANGGAGVTVIDDDTGSEPGTPPLPPAKALAVKPSAGGSTASSSATTTSAPTSTTTTTTTTADSLLWNRAKQWLARLSVERTPEQSARQLVQILCEVDTAGRIRQVVSTGAELRKKIIEVLDAIASLEKGRGFTDNGRKKFFGAWMAIPGGRHVLSTWLRQTVPPKKITEGVADLSRRYKDTLLPLLSILNYVPIKKAYLTDDAGLGKAITGVSLRAVDSSARKLAESLKAKWTKVIETEGSSTATNPRPAPASASTPASLATAGKRKPAENSAAAESSAKRYKTASTPASSAASAKTAKVAPASSTSSTAKPGLSFFGSSTTKKPTSAVGASSTSGSGGANRMNAHQSVMSLMDKLSGGNGSDRATAAQPGKDGTASVQNQEKRKKSVRWKEDSELVAIKLIEPADYSQGDDGDAGEAAQTGLGDEHDEGLALRQSVSTMEALMDWYEPREVIVTETDCGPVGSESVEGPFQTHRNAQLEEVVYEEGKEPDCPDENKLEQPGSISDPPEDLRGHESVEIPTPWLEEASSGLDAVDESAEIGEGYALAEQEPAGSAAAATSAGAPSTADLSALLSKVGQAIGGQSNAVPASGAASSSSAPVGATSAPVAALNFDVNQLQSILATANGSGPGSNAVNAAMQSSNVSSDNLSSLLSSLQSSVNGRRPNMANASEATESSYWQRTYRDNGTNAAPKQESYPGEYQQDYTSGGQTSQRYGNPSGPAPPTGPRNDGYHYGSTVGWDSGPKQHHGGYQREGYGTGDAGYGSGGGGGGGWQSKLHTKPCKFFAQGNCFRGNSCHFRH